MVSPPRPLRMPASHRPPRFVALVATLALLTWGTTAHAGSKNGIAALGQPAPGGGIFAGPSFTGWPSAAGNGWVAFRAKIDGGVTTESIVAADLTPPVRRFEIASLGTEVSGLQGVRFRQFLGRPTINANGDVAFVALLDQTDQSANAPDAAGLFVIRHVPPQGEAALRTVAKSGDATDAGILDFAATVDPNLDPGAVDVQERAPALNDLGEVAFLSALKSGNQAAGAIFTTAGTGKLRPVVRIGDAFGAETFISLGPPALNRSGLIAFHALLDGPTAEDARDGIFSTDGSTVSLLVRDGIEVSGVGGELDPQQQTIDKLGNLLSLNDAGDVAFTAGPLSGPSDFRCLDGAQKGRPCGGDDSRCDSSAGAGDGICSPITPQAIDDDIPGILLYRSGIVKLIAHSGKKVTVPNANSTAAVASRISGIVLGSAAGGQVAVPAIEPNGSVIYFASLNGGSSEVILRADANNGYTDPSILVVLGGPAPDPSPVGGTFTATLSAPAVDGVGGIAVLTRVSGGRVGEPLVYKPRTGAATAVITGDLLHPNGDDNAYFAGPPFGSPVMNAGGDVVFRAEVARGSSSVGIFRASPAGVLSALVRAGDTAPLPTAEGYSGAPHFVDLVGDVSLNDAGTTAFTGVVDQAYGRGVFTVGPEGIKPIAIKGAGATAENTTFTTIGLNPSISRDGGVAFRAAVESPDLSKPPPADPTKRPTIKQQGIFLADASGIHLLAAVGAPISSDPAALPFFKIRDPELTGLSSVAFRAQLGTDALTLTTGLFLATPSAIVTLASVGDDLGNGFTIADFSGVPTVDVNGNVAFLATRALGPRQSPALLRKTTAGLALLGWRGMPGPVGGTLKTFGQPNMNNLQHVAFRGTFQTGSGGKGGYLLAGDDGLSTLVQVGENTPFDGQFVSLGPKASLNDSDELAFTGTLSRGQYRNGVFTVSPANLSVEMLDLRLTGTGHDLVRLKTTLTVGARTNGLVPDFDRVAVSIADANGTFWQAGIRPGRLEQRKGALFGPVSKKALRPQLAGFGLTLTSSGATATLRSRPADFTAGGTRSLVPPFTVTFEVGDDGATANVDCTVRRSRVHCR